jgi:hypothetical protein
MATKTSKTTKAKATKESVVVKQTTKTTKTTMHYASALNSVELETQTGKSSASKARKRSDLTLRNGSTCSFQPLRCSLVLLSVLGFVRLLHSLTMTVIPLGPSLDVLDLSKRLTAAQATTEVCIFSRSPSTTVFVPSSPKLTDVAGRGSHAFEDLRGRPWSRPFHFDLLETD